MVYFSSREPLANPYTDRRPLHFSNPNSLLFTCLACQVAFRTPEHQRNHYQTDWHRYNLKRKVADLPAIAAEQFAQKVLTQQQAESKVLNFSCELCKKIYSTENAFKNHLQSKRHRDFSLRKEASETSETHSLEPDPYFPLSDTDQSDLSRNASKSDLLQEREIIKALNEADTEDKVVELLEKKMQLSVKLLPEDCLFCTHKSEGFDSNVLHMTNEHSLFIPDIEYVINIRGLIKYLGDKISVANCCIYCGRFWKSLEAVRKHMLDKGHCKLAYDKEEHMLEVSDYYDFRSSYPEDEELNMKSEASNDPGDEFEWVLPTGTIIGHRSLRRYYKQNLRPLEEKDSIIINRLLNHYVSNMGYQPGNRLGLIVAQNPVPMQSKSAFSEQRYSMDYKSIIGEKSNKLQHYFRSQIS